MSDRITPDQDLLIAAAAVESRRTTYKVVLEEIDRQRDLGWPEFHPEDYCHRCGARNVSWSTTSHEDWLTATSDWAAQTGREGICCTDCFLQMFEAATGEKAILMVTPVPVSAEQRVADPLTHLASIRPADRLRYAARLEREEWQADVRSRAFGVAAAIHMALADWLELTARRMDEGLGMPGDYHKPLAIAALIAGAYGTEKRLEVHSE